MNPPGTPQGPDIAPPQTHQDTEASTHLDALRGAAALVVFLNHTRSLYFTPPVGFFQRTENAMRLSASQSGVFGGEIKFASEAVIVFFVLSGYLVGGSVLKSLMRDRWSWRSYLPKRLVRLYMVLLPAILIGVSLDHLGLHFAGPGSVYFSPPGISIGTTYALVERLQWPVVLGNLAFLQDVLVPEVGTNVAVWSLANEFWYYMIFPMFAICFFRRYQGWVRALYFLAAIGLLLFIRAWIAAQFPIWVMGALLPLIPQRLSDRQARTGAMISFVILIATMVSARLLHLRAISADYLIAVATCLVLYCAIQLRGYAQPSLYKHVSGFFSRISYSLYLFHLPLAVFLCSRLNDPWKPWNKTAAHLATFAATELLIVAVVWVLWRTFEANTDAVRQRLFGS
jgi:peptidoglycan/LPS O-acetylase OafA/YrhL